MDLFFEKCKANGLKITPQRMAVYHAVKRAKTHPNAESIHQAVKKEYPNISLDTVNRTLVTFSQIRLLDTVEGFGDPRRYESDLSGHHHFYCLGCKSIFDIPEEEIAPVQLPEKLYESFTITGQRLCIRGYCSDCKPPES